MQVFYGAGVSGVTHDVNSAATPNIEGKENVVPNDFSPSVLIVEDDAAFLFILSEALSEGGYEVLTAANGREALAIYGQNADRIRLAIIDVMLPGMNGFTVAAEMRKSGSSLPFLFMSGYDTEEIRRQGVMDDIPDSNFFRKPFSYEVMLSRIRELLRDRKSAT